MWKRLSRRHALNPAENPENIRQRLQAAQRLVREQKERKSRSRFPIEEPRNREILPPDEPDATIPYQLPPSQTGDSTLAAALESILQGKRVGPDLFTQLYRGGFVFKDPHGQWRITAMGKELIEKHKLLTPEGFLVAAVRCAAGWNR
jgi:hypothetical protein